MILLDLALGVGSAALLLPAAVFAVECVLAPRRVKPAPSAPGARPPTAVVVPAHDEGPQIAGTVTHLLEQLGPDDRLVVVADNCSDDTAARAAEAGAEVLERSDPDHRGKGFALRFAFDALAETPPEVVVVVDADCRLGADALEVLARRARDEDRPMQAEYLMHPGSDDTKAGVSAFAFMVRNQARPRGLARLGLPVHLTGTGMAFPWNVLRAAHVEGGHIVEDLMLGLDLAERGHPVRLCSEAQVWSELPDGSQAALQQRSRWEHGQLHTLTTRAPRLVAMGLARGRVDLVALGLDLAVPPLALLVLLLGAMLALSGGAVLVGGSPIPLGLAAAGVALVTLGVFAAWLKLGQAMLPWYRFLAIPLYVLWKVPLYVALLVGRRTRQWKRTQRASER